MKISLINFLQNNNVQFAPKRSSLSPLASDTVAFSAKRKADIPFSVKQKEYELSLIRNALNKAIENSVFLDAENLSEKTGLDIYVVKLRLSTNNEIRRLVSQMQTAYNLRANKETLAFLSALKTLGQKLTAGEVAFYLGFSKEKLLELSEKSPEILSLFNDTQLKIKSCSLLEKKTQLADIKKATYHITKSDTYDSLAKKAELSPEIIRVRADENDELFNRLTNGRVYPPDIYPLDAVEGQEDKLMDAMLFVVKNGGKTDIKDLAKKTGVFPGTVLIRFKNNTALQDTYNRISGVNTNED